MSVPGWTFGAQSGQWGTALSERKLCFFITTVTLWCVAPLRCVFLHLISHSWSPHTSLGLHHPSSVGHPRQKTHTNTHTHARARAHAHAHTHTDMWSLAFISRLRVVCLLVSGPSGTRDFNRSRHCRRLARLGEGHRQTDRHC